MIVYIFLNTLYLSLPTGHGNCASLNNCTCEEGWYGDNCGTPSCEEVSDCSGQGLCVDVNECECNPGFDGLMCEEDISEIENTYTPTFNQSQYYATVLENLPTGAPVINISANDSDPGRNGEVSYSIASDAFAIDVNTGQISTRVMFDFESETQPKEYTLIAVAEDGGLPVKSSTAEMIIMVGDANDNCPVINDIESNLEVTSDVPIGSTIARVLATDADAGMNSELSYDFHQPSDTISNIFDITDGSILTKADVLPAGEYNIQVLISDKGDIPCSTQTQVMLTVLEALESEPTEAGPTSSSMTSTTATPTPTPILPTSTPTPVKVTTVSTTQSNPTTPSHPYTSQTSTEKQTTAGTSSSMTPTTKLTTMQKPPTTLTAAEPASSVTPTTKVTTAQKPPTTLTAAGKLVFSDISDTHYHSSTPMSCIGKFGKK